MLIPMKKGPKSKRRQTGNDPFLWPNVPEMVCRDDQPQVRSNEVSIQEVQTEKQDSLQDNQANQIDIDLFMAQID